MVLVIRFSLGWLVSGRFWLAKVGVSRPSGGGGGVLSLGSKYTSLVLSCEGTAGGAAVAGNLQLDVVAAATKAPGVRGGGAVVVVDGTCRERSGRERWEPSEERKVLGGR